MKFSLVISTYKRHSSLKRTLDSVLSNKCLPQEILVIDDDSVPTNIVESFKEAFEQKNVSFEYHKKDHSKIRKGLSESKNWASELASGDIIYFIDDDVILEKDHFDHLFTVWEQNFHDHTLIGVGGRATNNRKTTHLEKIFRAVFGLNGKFAWDVNKVGFQVWDESVQETQKAFYLHGCSSSYRKDLLLKFPFDTFGGGRTGLEDVEQCLAAKKAGYHFLYTPSIRLLHLQEGVGREAAFLSGKKETINRREIFLKHCKQDWPHKIWYSWASIGWVLKKVLAFRFRQAGGMIAGHFRFN